MYIPLSLSCRLEVIDVAEGTKDSEEVRLR